MHGPDVLMSQLHQLSHRYHSWVEDLHPRNWGSAPSCPTASSRSSSPGFLWGVGGRKLHEGTGRETLSAIHDIIKIEGAWHVYSIYHIMLITSNIQFHPEALGHAPYLRRRKQT